MNLAPALQAANLHPAIFGNDTSWQSENYANAVVAGPAHTGLAGIAWHCYNGVPEAMSDLHAGRRAWSRSSPSARPT